MRKSRLASEGVMTAPSRLPRGRLQDNQAVATVPVSSRLACGFNYVVLKQCVWEQRSRIAGADCWRLHQPRSSRRPRKRSTQRARVGVLTSQASRNRCIRSRPQALSTESQSPSTTS